MKIKRVYVAGAYSGDTCTTFENMRKGIKLSREVLDAGFVPFCPWLDYLFSIINEGMTLERYYKYSMSWLEVCDAVLLVPGWEGSKGTQKELVRAAELNIPVFHSVQELVVHELPF